MKNIVTVIIRLIHFCFDFIIKRINRFILKLLSIYRSFSMYSFGKDSFLSKGVQVIGGKEISIGTKVFVGRFSTLSTWHSSDYCKVDKRLKLIIGDNVSIGDFAHISAINMIEIGNRCLLGKFVTMVDNYHGASDILSLEIPPSKRPLISKGKVIIGDDVWIGDKVTILSGVKIGKGSVVGSNSVVTKSFPDYSIIGGNPAKALVNRYLGSL